MTGNLLRMIFDRFDLPLPVFRGSKGRIWMKSLMQQLGRAYHIHTPLVSGNAVNIWCMECIWISYRMRLLDRAPVCMGGEGFTSTSLLHLHKSLIVPFVVLFLGQVIFPLFYGCLSVCCVYVCCLYGCGVVWCGGAPLSLSLWIVAGMVVAWLDSRAVGEAQGPACNCGDADGLERAIAGQRGSCLPRYPSTP
jgi:hypothetical protein